MSFVGGDWWGAILWSGAPTGTYQSYAQSISRSPITLVQLYIDTCSRSFGVAPCDGTGAQCYNTYTTCKNKASYLKATKILEFVTVDTGTPFKQGERPYLLSVDYLPTEIKDSLTVSGRLKIKIADEPDTDWGIDPYRGTRGIAYQWQVFLSDIEYQWQLLQGD